MFLISHINKELKSILQPDAPYDSDGIRLSARSKGESAALKVTPFIFILLFIRHPKMQMWNVITFHLFFGLIWSNPCSPMNNWKSSLFGTTLLFLVPWHLQQWILMSFISPIQVSLKFITLTVQMISNILLIFFVIIKEVMSFTSGFKQWMIMPGLSWMKRRYYYLLVILNY